MKRMAPSLLFAFLATAAMVGEGQAFVAPSGTNYEILLPELDMQSISSPAIDAARAQSINSLTAEYGGVWNVYTWNSLANTPSALYGSGHETGRSLATRLSAEQAGRAVIEENAAALGVSDLANLRFLDDPRGAGKVATHFQQTYHGIDVIGGKVYAIFTDSGRVFVMGSDYYNGISLDPNPSILEDEATQIAKNDVPFDPATDSIDGQPELFVLPVPLSDTDVDFHLVWRVRVSTADPLGIWVTHVDAHTGQIVYRYNDVHFLNFSGQEQGNTEVMTLCNGETPGLPHPYQEVTITGVGSTTSDSNGNWTIPYAGTDNRTITSRFYGPYIDVNVNNGTDASFSSTATPGTPFNVLWTDSNSRQDERDSFYAVQQIHDLFERFDPGWFYTNQRITCWVNRNGTCNAYWNGTINFYPAGGGCANTGEIGGVVHHEFGHGVQNALLGQQGSQGLGEGNGDVLANMITLESAIGRGFQSCSQGLRDSDNNLVYPDDVVGQEIHNAGRVIAGFHWDANVVFRGLLGETAGQTKVASDWHFARKLSTPTNQPAQVLATFVTDDDDGNLNNGTPFYDVYCAAATHHGFSCPAVTQGVTIAHDEVWTTTTPGNRTLTANITTTAANIATAEILYSIGDGTGGFTSAPMSPIGGGNYQGTIPGLTHPATVVYYIHAVDNQGNQKTSPALAPFQTYDFDLAQAYDALESESGWVVNLEGTDTATAGQWVRVDPNGTTIQPEDDTTPSPGTMCWVTGNGVPGGAAHTADVDNGVTTLYSPVYNMAGASQLTLKFWQFFSNSTGPNPAQDAWVVQVRNNGGPWVDIINTLDQWDGWDVFQTDLLAIVPAPGDLQFKFTAQDNIAESFVDAGIDDFTILGVLGTVDAPEETSVARFALNPSTPNPTSDIARIRFQVPTTSQVQIKIFDVSGREVSTVADGRFEAGSHTVDWNGRDAAGHEVASGVYYYRMNTGSYTATRSLIISR
ncbi:MAG: FlgD immunoglobulin-like domain containing protein [Candidatus Eisenbacteria bacterium]|uniref:T9SS type A sorting domain-containing protein n=1 Tax=Eiseniibacteriota bacterium TaxID=2212470 RepID=A0A956M0E8_UNCEI|nr:T9SS type A sorting domain-containing protein [Candidatus Eisenbacteria bacterium]